MADDAVEQDDRFPNVSDDVIDSFARRLEAYADELPPDERVLLELLIMRAASPLDRMLARDASEVLDPDEEAVLTELLGPPGG